MFLDVEVDVASFGKRDDLARECSVVKFEPFDEAEVFGLFDGIPHCGIFLVFFDCHDIACFDEVGRNVHCLAVDGDVTVVDDLASHSS